MFAEKLTVLLDAVNASGTAVAKYAQLDRTSISRMKSGSRQSKQNSKTVRKLIRGICSYCAGTDQMDTLYSLLKLDPGTSQEETESRLSEWLFDDAVKTDNIQIEETNSLRLSQIAFGKHLDAVMTMLSLSNIRLSQLVYADPSLISRYRNGLRKPKAGSDMAEKLCKVLWERTEKTDRRTEMAELIQCPEQQLDEQALYLWLYRYDENPRSAIHTAEKIIHVLDAYSAYSGSSAPELSSDILSADTETGQTLYIGTAGLRQAVLRFLSNAAKNHEKHLMLYSDQDMEWMTSDPAFFKTWSSLMTACVKNGTKITIIHNIDRDIDEMNQAIAGWLPLYMSGMIESYFCRRERDRRFSHTFFLCPKSACIRSFHVTASESDAVYHYFTDRTVLSRYESEYIDLIHHSQTLFTMKPYTESGEQHDRTIIRSTLPLDTMPEEIVKSFQNEALYHAWRTKQNQNTGAMITEYIPVISENTVSAGTIPVELVPGIQALYYSTEQYKAHLENLSHIEKSSPNRRFIPLKHIPFHNVTIVMEDQTARIICTSRTAVAFETSNPMMCRAFAGYTKQLAQEQRIRNTGR